MEEEGREDGGGWRREGRMEEERKEDGGGEKGRMRNCGSSSIIKEVFSLKSN